MSEELERKSMKIFLDSSDVNEITKAVDTGLIDGVTTNPTLMLQSGLNPKDVLESITQLFGWDASVSAEVSGDTVEEMLEMADEYVQINPNITIKLPLQRRGFKVCNDLASDDIKQTLLLYFQLHRQSLQQKQERLSYHLSWVGLTTTIQWCRLSRRYRCNILSTW